MAPDAGEAVGPWELAQADRNAETPTAQEDGLAISYQTKHIFDRTIQQSCYLVPYLNKEQQTNEQKPHINLNIDVYWCFILYA